MNLEKFFYVQRYSLIVTDHVYLQVYIYVFMLKCGRGWAVNRGGPTNTVNSSFP